MTDLVAADLRGREVAGAAHSRELIEERRVEIHALIARAVERPGGRARVAASRLHRAGEDRELRRLIALSGLREQRAPDVLGAAEHARDEIADFVVRRERPALLAARRAATAGKELHDGVGPAEEEQQPEDHEQSDAAA